MMDDKKEIQRLTQIIVYLDKYCSQVYKMLNNKFNTFTPTYFQIPNKEIKKFNAFSKYYQKKLDKLR